MVNFLKNSFIIVFVTSHLSQPSFLQCLQVYSAVKDLHQLAQPWVLGHVNSVHRQMDLLSRSVVR